ncbi:hypothetical protein SISNIDRAFT_491609 [Sistotremastrum niveocremeum HHB9708]|uniref:Uncharacterized protein n=1 Tax=Sistotremastrum niveocremeum HHB9708 TaxID=1314777 RepID=A0A164MLS0_9AGAM|nr:hypothetical protein SISNIDRAFT_491609 [Sistotremastrum niveocremeum HHB9708]
MPTAAMSTEIAPQPPIAIPNKSPAMSTPSLTPTTPSEDLSASLSSKISNLAQCRRALGPEHRLKRLKLDQALDRVFRQICLYELPLPEKLNLFIVGINSLILPSPASIALNAQTFWWLYPHIRCFMSMVRGKRESHRFMSEVLHRMLLRIWKDNNNMLDEFLYRISSTYLGYLDRALCRELPGLEHREIGLETLGCGCQRCNLEAEVILRGLDTKEEHEDNHLPVAEILAGRSAFFAILDQLSPRRCLDICIQLQVCPSLARGSQLLRHHQDRRSPRLDALIAQHLLVPSSSPPSSPSPPLLLSPIQKSEAAYRAAQLTYQLTYHGPRKRKRAPNSDAQDRRPTKRQRLSVGDEDSDDEDAVIIVIDGRHQNPLSMYSHGRAPWRPYPQYLSGAAATGISSITKRAPSSHVASGSDTKQTEVGSKAISLGKGAVENAAADRDGRIGLAGAAGGGASNVPSANKTPKTGRRTRYRTRARSSMGAASSSAATATPADEVPPTEAHTKAPAAAARGGPPAGGHARRTVQGRRKGA